MGDLRTADFARQFPGAVTACDADAVVQWLVGGTLESPECVLHLIREG